MASSLAVFTVLALVSDTVFESTVASSTHVLCNRWVSSSSPGAIHKCNTAPEALYGHYETIFHRWMEEDIPVPPCFIVVCNNTSTSKLVYDYISGFDRENEDGSTTLQQGRFELFRNFDENGNQIPIPRTLLIDSEQIESGDALDRNFRRMAADEIERFRREIVERTGDRSQAERITDQELLREVMNTVGKEGRLGGQVRCVVSVSMLTEGWDANTVTHVLGVRAFGTQLLCEQVVGRALRRQSYEVNECGKFNPEYADVLGVPFDFTDRPVVVKPQNVRPTIEVKAVRPDRDDLEIRFPRVIGYRVDLPREELSAEFNSDSILELTPELIGATNTRNEAIIGEGVNLDLVHTGDLDISFQLGDAAKWPKAGVCKTLFGGSNPPVASMISREKGLRRKPEALPYAPHSRAHRVEGSVPVRWPTVRSRTRRRVARLCEAEGWIVGICGGIFAGCFAVCYERSVADDL